MRRDASEKKEDAMKRTTIGWLTVFVLAV